MERTWIGRGGARAVGWRSEPWLFPFLFPARLFKHNRSEERGWREGCGRGWHDGCRTECEGEISSQRDRPDRLPDTRRCYIRFRQQPGVLEGAGAVGAELNIKALVSGSREHCFMTVSNGAKLSLCARSWSPRTVQAHGGSSFRHAPG
jgi:hypothetical protein